MTLNCMQHLAMNNKCNLTLIIQTNPTLIRSNEHSILISSLRSIIFHWSLETKIMNVLCKGRAKKFCLGGQVIVLIYIKYKSLFI